MLNAVIVYDIWHTYRFEFLQYVPSVNIIFDLEMYLKKHSCTGVRPKENEPNTT